MRYTHFLRFQTDGTILFKDRKEGSKTEVENISELTEEHSEIYGLLVDIAWEHGLEAPTMVYIDSENGEYESRTLDYAHDYTKVEIEEIENDYHLRKYEYRDEEIEEIYYSCEDEGIDEYPINIDLVENISDEELSQVEIDKKKPRYVNEISLAQFHNYIKLQHNPPLDLYIASKKRYAVVEK